MARMATNWYRPNRVGMLEMLNSEKILGPALHEIGTQVEAEAVATAPVDPETSEHFKDSFHSEVVHDTVLSKYGAHEGLIAHIYSDDPAGLSIETGTAKTPPHNTLSTALRVIG